MCLGLGWRSRICFQVMALRSNAKPSGPHIIASVVFFRRMAEVVGQYLKKGSSVYIEGQLQTNSYEDKNTGEKKYSTQIVARDMQMLGSRNSSETQSNTSEEATMDQTPMDDEIPF